MTGAPPYLNIWIHSATLCIYPATLVTSQGTPLFGLNKDVLVSFFRRVDNPIHWINVYPLNNAIGFLDTYPLDSDLSGG